MLNNIRDRLLSIELKRDEKEVKIGFLIVGIILILLLANIVYLNFILVKNKSVNSNISSTSTPVSVVNPSVSPTIAASSNPSVAPTITPQSATKLNLQTTVKDYFIPLGSGSNQSSDWADVQGAQVTVDLGQYQNIKEIHLESSIDVPTANGTVSIRLYNKTDKHPVWSSETTANANMGLYLISPAISYDSGSKLYQVQMKTQLQVVANLLQSRIHVTLN